MSSLNFKLYKYSLSVWIIKQSNKNDTFSIISFSKDPWASAIVKYYTFEQLLSNYISIVPSLTFEF